MNQPLAAIRNLSGPRRRQGYLLLAVVVCLLIAGIALAALARQSLRLVTEATTRHEALQVRWGIHSCQRTLLSSAESIFEARDERLEEQDRDDRPASLSPSIDTAITLGKYRFDLRLSDESAKLNVNLVYHLRGRSHAERAVRQMLRTDRAAPVRLVPATAPVNWIEQDSEDEPVEPPEAAFRSWGEVLDLAQLPPGQATRMARIRWTTQLTCWGRGLVNVRHAPDDVISEVCRLVVSDGVAAKLVRSYRKEPRLAIAGHIQKTAGRGEEGLRLQQLLGEQSDAYSLWVTVSSPRRQWQELAVSQRVDEGVTRTRHFAF